MHIRIYIKKTIKEYENLLEKVGKIVKNKVNVEFDFVDSVHYTEYKSEWLKNIKKILVTVYSAKNDEHSQYEIDTEELTNHDIKIIKNYRKLCNKATSVYKSTQISKYLVFNNTYFYKTIMFNPVNENANVYKIYYSTNNTNKLSLKFYDPSIKFYFAKHNIIHDDWLDSNITNYTFNNYITNLYRIIFKRYKQSSDFIKLRAMTHKGILD